MPSCLSHLTNANLRKAKGLRKQACVSLSVCVSVSVNSCFDKKKKKPPTFRTSLADLSVKCVSLQPYILWFRPPIIPPPQPQSPFCHSQWNPHQTFFIHQCPAGDPVTVPIRHANVWFREKAQTQRGASNNA